MHNKRLTTVIGLFGLVVIASGLFRYFTTPGGQNGLKFGLVMGGLALVGAVFALLNLRLVAQLIGLAAIVFVILWFGYETYKDWKELVVGPQEIRKLVVVIAGIAAAWFVLRPGK